MTPKQFQDVYDMISASVNNTNLLGDNLKNQYNKTLNIETNIALLMQNQNTIFLELQEIKELLLEKLQK